MPSSGKLIASSYFCILLGLRIAVVDGETFAPISFAEHSAAFIARALSVTSSHLPARPLLFFNSSSILSSNSAAYWST
jgi:hypothetical protein